MNKALRVFQILSCIYIIAGSVSFMSNYINEYSLVKIVESKRIPSSPECVSLQETGDESVFWQGCPDENLGTSRHYTWVDWQFLSNNRGYNRAHYIPLDITVLMLANGVSYVVFRKKRKPKE